VKCTVGMSDSEGEGDGSDQKSKALEWLRQAVGDQSADFHEGLEQSAAIDDDLANLASVSES